MFLLALEIEFTFDFLSGDKYLHNMEAGLYGDDILWEADLRKVTFI